MTAVDGNSVRGLPLEEVRRLTGAGGEGDVRLTVIRQARSAVASAAVAAALRRPPLPPAAVPAGLIAAASWVAPPQPPPAPASLVAETSWSIAAVGPCPRSMHGVLAPADVGEAVVAAGAPRSAANAVAAAAAAAAAAATGGIDGLVADSSWGAAAAPAPAPPNLVVEASWCVPAAAAAADATFCSGINRGGEPAPSARGFAATAMAGGTGPAGRAELDCDRKPAARPTARWAAALDSDRVGRR